VAGEPSIEGVNIGELARRSGLSVKTVRYYSDLGLVPEAGRTRSGHRRYDGAAALRLDFVRTLRELGLDLATTRRVLDREADLPRVAGAHAEALSAQIRLLRVRRSVLRSLARRSALSEKEVQRMNRIAQATAEERRRLISEFLDSIFDGLPVDPDFAARLRSVTPELPGRTDDAAYRRELLAALELAVDPRPERYWQLMGIINGWPPFSPATPAFGWFASALRSTVRS
jgi:DNA-binding transcriptional MerR regulator